MFHSRPHLRFHTLQLHGEFFEQAFRHGFDFAALGRHMPLHARAGGGDLLALLHAQIARIGVGCLLPAMEQGVGLRDVRG